MPLFTPVLIALFCNDGIRGSLKTVKIKMMGPILHTRSCYSSPPELLMLLLFIIFIHCQLT